MSLAFGFALPHWQALSAGFNPISMFAGGVNGVLYDPSDLTTLFTTSSGTTPVSMPGQGSAVSVGLMLDKSQNGVGTNGAKRVNLLTYSEDFSNAAWTGSVAVSANTTVAPNGTATADTITVASTGTYRVRRRSPAGLLANVQFVLSVSAKAGVTNWISLRFWDTAPGVAAWFNLATGAVGTVQAGCTASISDQGNGWYRCSITRTVGSSIAFNELDIGVTDGDNTDTGTTGASVILWGADLRLTSEASTLPLYQRIGANWYSTMAGNHAIAFNNTTARPELRARVNLLTYSEEFDNGAWTNASTAITANTAVAPNNTTTADTLTNLITGFSYFGRTSITPAASTDWSIAVKYSGSSQWFLMNFGAGATTAVWFDIQNGLVGTQASGSVGSIQALGNGWYRCTVRRTTSLGGDVYCACADADNSTTATAGKNVFIWGADLRPANIGANVPAYQRIADANTYDTSGFPLYLRFDGIDDSMYTPANVNLSGTDKVSVFAGVRKFNNTTQQFIVETSTNGFLSNGAFSLLTNTNSVGGTVAGAYGGTFRGTSRADYGATGTTAPISNVVTALGNIAAATDASILRVNGTQVATSGATSAGTGNFGTYPMYIASRQGVAPNLLEGHLYSLLVVGSAVSAGNISATEQWVAGKTGITI